MTAAVSAQDAMPTTRGLNFYLADRNLQWLCRTLMPREVFERAEPHLVAMGEAAGGVVDALAVEADRNPPLLRPYDERGRRVDEVVRHPSYREIERIAFSRFGLAAMSHRAGVLGWPGRAPHLLKYTLAYLFSQSAFGLLCPVNVTDSTSRMLRLYGSEELRARYLPRLTSTDFEELWQGTQWMTERTGGSDVGASTTVARQGSGWRPSRRRRRCGGSRRRWTAIARSAPSRASSSSARGDLARASRDGGPGVSRQRLPPHPAAGLRPAGGLMGDPFGRDDPHAFASGDERVAVQGESGLQQLDRLRRRHGPRISGDPVAVEQLVDIIR